MEVDLDLKIQVPMKMMTDIEISSKRSAVFLFMCLYYFQEKSGADKDGYFEATYADIRSVFGLSKHTIQEGFKLLLDQGYIHQKPLNAKKKVFQLIDQNADETPIAIRLRVFLQFVGLPKTILFVYLSLHYFRQLAGKKMDEWFEALQERLVYHMKYSPATLHSAKNKLLEMGLIQVKRGTNTKVPNEYRIIQE